MIQKIMRRHPPVIINNSLKISALGGFNAVLDEQKCEINLRSTISRLNKTLREYGVNGRIISHNNGYRLEIENLEVDAFRLEKITDEWLKNQSKVSLSLHEFYKLYPGHLFANQDYSWAEWLQSYYLRTFISLGKVVVRSRIEGREDMHITYQMIEYIVGLDPYNEDLREMVLEILYKTEGRRAAKLYYMEFERQLESQVGVHPRQSLKELYQRIIN